MSLLETMVGLALSVLVISAVFHQLTTATLLVHDYRLAQRRLFVSGQVEHLLDTGLAAARTNPLPGHPIADLTSAGIKLAADLDGDGRLDAGSAETTVVSLETGDRGLSLRHRIGRQKMTVIDELPAGSRLLALDDRGTPARRARDIALLSMPIGTSQPGYFAVAPPR